MRKALGSHILINVDGLSDRHVRALRRFADKFIRGAREHGDLHAGRKWTRDMLDESLDKSFYEIFTLLDMEDADEEMLPDKE